MKLDTSEVWLADSGASRHITCRREWLVNFKPFTNNTVISGITGETAVLGVGDVNISRYVDGQWYPGTLSEVWLVPGCGKNLLATGVCMSRGLRVLFDGREVEIRQEGNLIATGFLQPNQLCRMQFKTIVNEDLQVNAAATDLRMWHERMGHVNVKITDMAKKGTVNGLKISKAVEFTCEACCLGKAHRTSFRTCDQNKRVFQVGEFFHSDVCGPMQVESLGGNRYFLTFIDDASNYRKVYFMKHKSYVFECFKAFEREVATKFNRTMKVLRSDRGLEYMCKNMKSYLSQRGICPEVTAGYTPEQNGKAERENRTIVESARSMLNSKNLPKSLWAEAVNTAVYILNRVMGSRTPDELWTGRKPTVEHLRVFGTEARAHVPKIHRKKLDDKSIRVIFVGYQDESMNYKIYDPVTRKVSESRDVIFLEDNWVRSPAVSSVQIQEINENDYIDFPVTIDDIPKQEHNNANNQSSSVTRRLITTTLKMMMKFISWPNKMMKKMT